MATSAVLYFSAVHIVLGILGILVLCSAEKHYYWASLRESVEFAYGSCKAVYTREE